MRLASPPDLPVASADVRACPACGSRGGRSLVRALRLRLGDGHPLQGGYRVVTCGRCGTGFADATATLAYYEAYYRDLAKYAAEGALYEGAPIDPDWLLEKADDSARRIDALLARPDAAVLDIGCSTGGILGALARRGYTNLTGIDPAEGSVRLANARPGVRAMVGSFSTLPEGLGRFDCICVTGVFEHLWDPDAAVAAIRPLLEPDGVVYIEVPDAARYLDPYLAPYEDFSSEHVNHFSFLGLRHLGARHGFGTVSETSYLGALTGTVSTGCAAVAWREDDGPIAVAGRDAGLEATLRAFDDRSAADFAAIEAHLEAELGDEEAFALWGVGEATFKLLALAPLARRRIVALADGNPARRGLRFGGLAVSAPSELPAGRVPIVIGSLLRAEAIVAAAAELGLPNPLIRLDEVRAAAR